MTEKQVHLLPPPLTTWGPWRDMASWVAYMHLNSQCLMTSITVAIIFVIKLKIVSPCFMFCQVYPVVVMSDATPLSS